MITLLLLIRFVINLRAIFYTTRHNPVVLYNGARIVLLDKEMTPHSFLNYIFINRAAYENGNISQQILLHELTHIRQKHSWDILFIEVLQVLFWFNPVLIFYKKAIQLNHEFLADEKVIDSGNDAASYQYLLIGAASQLNSSLLTSRFNFSVTKKRIAMITKNRSFRNAIARQLAIIPVIAVAVTVFSTRIEAQENPPIVITKKEVPSTPAGVPQEQLDEYQLILNKVKDEKGRYAIQKLSEADKNRLQTIFLAMSKDQQAKQTVIFMPVPPPFAKAVPTQAQIESWKNAKMYGLWINEKRVSNAELSNYSNTDFSHVFVSKLTKNAVNYGKHYYQVDLMTNEYYEKYRREALANKNKYFIAVKWTKLNVVK